MRTLTLVEQGVTLAVEGETFRIERDGNLLTRARMAEFDQVTLCGCIHLTHAAIVAVLARGTDLVFLTRSGRYRGRLVGKPGKNVELRIAQFERLRDPAFALGGARAIVAGKIANQRNLLLRAQRERKSEDLAGAIGRLRLMAEAAAGAESVEALRGLEGNAAAAYFGAFGWCLRNPEFSFAGRTRRPPRDPVNALLSFGYTILAAVAESIVLRAGLDPMLGAFHSADYGRPSLVLDLIEEFRPVLVDALALRLINRREIGPSDFGDPEAAVEDAWSASAAPVPEDGAVHLGPTGRKIFFRAWGRRMNEVLVYPARGERLAFEDIVRHQVYHFARVVRGEDPAYRPFVPR